jgi:flagellar biogenesis protein FliO
MDNQQFAQGPGVITRGRLLVGIIVILALVGGGFGWYLSRLGPRTTPAAKGTVVSVNRGAESFSVATNQATMNVKTTNTTKFVENSTGSFSLVKVGETVIIAGTTSDNTITATQVRVLPPQRTRPPPQ